MAATRYAKNGEIHIAYQVHGDGPIDVVLVSSTVRDLIAGSGIELEGRGLHELKGVAEPRALYAVVRATADS